MLLTKDNVHEFFLAYQQWQSTLPKPEPIPHQPVDLTRPPFFVALYEQEKVREEKERGKGNLQLKAFIKQHPEYQPLEKIVVDNNLQFSHPDAYLIRIRSAKDKRNFVDFWATKKRKMKRVDGTFTTQGDNLKTLVAELQLL